MSRAGSLGRLLAVALAAACSADEPAAPGGPTSVHVTLNVSPPQVVPGESSTLTTTATVSGGALLAHGMKFGGLFDTTLQFPIGRDTAQTVYLTLTVPNGPIAGILTVAAFAKAGSLADTARGTLTIGDDGPPKAWLRLPSAWAPGVTLPLSFDASDAAGITSVTLTVSGATTFTFQQAYDYAPFVTRGVYIPVSSSPRLGDSVQVALTVTDGFQNVTTVKQAAYVADNVLPTVSEVLAPVPQYDWGPATPQFPPLFAGDSARLVVRATDNYRLAWIGYRLGQAGDSVPVSSLGDSAVFLFAAPTGVNALATLEAFARDSVGLRSGDPHTVDLVDAARRAITWLAGAMAFRAEVHDAKRDIVFAQDVNNTSQVAVASLNPPANLKPIPVPGVVMAMDLTPGGDSLVVAVDAGTPDLVVMDLTQPSWAATAMKLPLGTVPIWGMRVTAADRALASVALNYGALLSQIAEADLTTRAVRFRPVPNWPLKLDRSGDHSLIVAAGTGIAATYDAATDTFAAVKTVANLSSSFPFEGRAVIDSTGDRVLFGYHVYDRSLNLVRDLPVSCSGGPGLYALSADGHWAFFTERAGCYNAGYQKIDATTGAVAETVYLPIEPQRILALPDGQRLLVSAYGLIGLVDLR